MRKRLTTKEFIKKANIVHNNKYNYSKAKYMGTDEKVCIVCKEYGEFWQRPNNHINVKNGCPECNGGIKNTSIDFIQKANKVHGNKYDYSKIEYKRSKIKVKIVCPEHGEFWQNPNDHLNGKSCHTCKSSIGENKVSNLLTESGIKFEKQKTFKNCRDKGVLPFDFYLPEYNILIEYDGIQHFKPVKRFSGDKVFKQIQKHDEIKTVYALDNNIDLIRISYENFNNIEKILEEEIYESEKT